MPGLAATEKVQTSAQYAAVSEYVAGKSASLEEALDKFSEPVESHVASTDSDDGLETVLASSWKAVISTAAETSFTDSGMQKLVDMLIELASRDDVEKDGKARVVHDMTLWRDLPLLGWQMRDSWNLAATDKDDESHQQQWINLNAWTASLVAAAHSQTEDKPDFSLYCIWTVRSALEQTDDMPSNTTLSAAAVWFIFASTAIVDFCKQEKSFQGRLAAAGPAFKDQEWKGFTLERWSKWSKKLSNVQNQISDNVTVQLVQQAQEAMSKAAK